MIISKREFLFRAQLDQETLEVWIAEEWLVPGGTVASCSSPKPTWRALS